MFKLFKKNKNQQSDSIFPKAKSTLETSTSKWEYVTAEKILERIESESSKGRRKASFYNSIISNELVKELRSQGYKVEVNASPISIGPYFDIFW